MRVWKGLAAMTLFTAIFVAPVSAFAFNTRITVYAAVPMMRNIYIDDQGFITKVVGNTSQNITPMVYDQKNQPVPMSDSINQQYQQFLKSHNFNLEASKYYYLQVPVVNAPNTQTVQVNTAQNKLTLTL